MKIIIIILAREISFAIISESPNYFLRFARVIFLYELMKIALWSKL